MSLIRERLAAFWSGEKPDRIPYTTYANKIPPDWSDPVIQQMFADGLGVVQFVPTWKAVYDGVEQRSESWTAGGDTFRRDTWITPAGHLTAAWKNGWEQEFLLKTAEDYRVMMHIAERMRYEPAYEQYNAAAAAAPDYMLTLTRIGRTPLQTILVDYAGLENFAFQLADFADEIEELYAIMRRNFKQLVEVVAAGPGRYINVLENFTAETLGPRRYARYLLPVYEETFGILHESGKVVGCHYDGQLRSVKDHVARAPLDIIESLTEPPEGDMTIGEARAAFPDKLFWAHVNLGVYELPEDALRAEIARRVREGAPDGRLLAFEVSEAQPPRWRESMPVILDTLNNL